MIHDDLVGSWLAANGRPDLSPARWVTDVYQAYLGQMHAWADELGMAAEDIEFLIFQSMADDRGGQWTSGPRTAEEDTVEEGDD